MMVCGGVECDVNDVYDVCYVLLVLVCVVMSVGGVFWFVVMD